MLCGLCARHSWADTPLPADPKHRTSPPQKPDTVRLRCPTRNFYPNGPNNNLTRHLLAPVTLPEQVRALASANSRPGDNMRERIKRESSRSEQLIDARNRLDETHGHEFLAVIHDAIIARQLMVLPMPGVCEGFHAREFDLALRQECYAQFVSDDKLNKPLLEASLRGKRLVVGLPGPWLDVLSENGIPVARHRSSMLWVWRVLGSLYRGLGRALTQLPRLLSREEQRRSRGEYGSSTFLHAVATENLPVGRDDLPPTDLVSWLRKDSPRASTLGSIFSGVRDFDTGIERVADLRYARFPLAIPSGLRGAGRLMKGFAALGCRLTFRALFCRWQYLVMSSQLVDKTLLDAGGGRGQAKLHLFNNSSALRRPLWSIHAKTLGIESICYFYSANIEPRGSVPFPDCGRVRGSFRLCWWDELWVWDTRQSVFLCGVAERTSLHTRVKPVTFTASTVKLNDRISRRVAVFDVTPFGPAHRATATESLMYSPSHVHDFLLEIQQVTFELGLGFAWKSKRHLSSEHDSTYLEIREHLAHFPNVEIVPLGVSAEQLIENSFAVISIPFTSTGLVARDRGRPSAFFDPTGRVPNPHPAGRDLPLFRGKTDLQSWLSEFVSLAQ